MLAADEACQLGGQVVALGASSNRRDVLAQHRLLEPSQLLARLQSELSGEQLSRSPVRSERVRLALAAVEREHELAPESLAQRVLGNQRFQLAHKLGVEPEVELCLDAPF